MLPHLKPNYFEQHHHVNVEINYLNFKQVFHLQGSKLRNYLPKKDDSDERNSNVDQGNSYLISSISVY